MPVKPEVQQFLDLLASFDLGPMADVTPEQLRASFAAMTPVGTEEVASIVDDSFDGVHGPVAVRAYRPAGSVATDVLPALVWYHGGGFVIGDLDTADSECRGVANQSGAVVVSVDYHLAPEHPYPAAVDDAVDALRWVVDHAADLGVDPTRLAVGGDSAGGNLAAVTAQLAKAAGGPALAFQLLVYPVTDGTASHPSIVENATGYFLTSETMQWFLHHYLGGRDATGPRVSPLAASDLSGLPPALVITAEYDPLRDEGEAYAAKLTAAGVPVEHVRYDGQIHGFFGMDHLPDTHEARARAGGSLANALGATTGRV